MVNAMLEGKRVKITAQRPFLKTNTRYYKVWIEDQPSTVVMVTQALICDTHHGIRTCECITALRNSTLLEDNN